MAIVGSGVAGLVAALVAQSIGLRPIVLEKAQRIGGLTASSWGLIWVPGNSFELAAGIVDSRAAAVDYLRFLAAGYHSEERLLPSSTTHPRRWTSSPAPAYADGW